MEAPSPQRRGQDLDCCEPDTQNWFAQSTPPGPPAAQRSVGLVNALFAKGVSGLQGDGEVPAIGSVCERVLALSEKAQKLLEQMIVYVEPPTTVDEAEEDPTKLASALKSGSRSLSVTQGFNSLLACGDVAMKEELEGLKFRVSNIELELARTRGDEELVTQDENKPLETQDDAQEVQGMMSGQLAALRHFAVAGPTTALPKSNCHICSLSASALGPIKDPAQTARRPVGSSTPALSPQFTTRRQYSDSAAATVWSGGEQRRQQSSPFRIALVPAVAGHAQPRCLYNMRPAVTGPSASPKIQERD